MPLFLSLSSRKAGKDEEPSGSMKFSALSVRRPRMKRKKQVSPSESATDNQHEILQDVAEGSKAVQRLPAMSKPVHIATQTSFKQARSYSAKQCLTATCSSHENPLRRQYEGLLAEFKNASLRSEAFSVTKTNGFNWQAFRRSLFRILEQPDSSIWASFVAWTISALIILSTVVYCAESVQSISGNCGTIRVLFVIDALCCSAFALEYLLRWIASPAPLCFPLRLSNIIDLIAIVPFYISPFMPECGSDGQVVEPHKVIDIELRFLRILRVFRVFKLTGYGAQLELVTSAVKESREMLAMFIINLLVVIIVFSSIVYLCEKNEEDTEFTSIPASCWWALVTVLTVGYGDMYPQTILGKLMASVLMITALIVIALPVSIIGTNFTLAWERFKEEQKALDRASKLPGRLRQALPLMELWMEDLYKHFHALRKETISLRSLADQLRKAKPEQQFEILKDMMKSAETVLNLTKDDVKQATASCNTLAGHIQEAQGTLDQLNSEGEMVLAESVQAVQRSFRAAVKHLVEHGMQSSPVTSSYNVANGDMSTMGKDLSKYSGTLLVYIVGCKDLPLVTRLADIPDAYVTLTCGEESCRTHVVKNSVSPLFDCTLLLPMADASAPVLVELWDQEFFGKDEYLGSYTLSLSEADTSSSTESWEHLQSLQLDGPGKTAGTIMLRYRYWSLANLTDEQLSDPMLWPKLFELAVGQNFQVIPSLLAVGTKSGIATSSNGPRPSSELVTPLQHSREDRASQQTESTASPSSARDGNSWTKPAAVSTACCEEGLAVGLSPLQSLLESP
mmetsp:Transcript_15392/g.36567  ORF Transcript_15392/g.36567 Transcript_15392/m.36567 type:complete len:794 (+) Transcript_15392:707-3088(+)